MPEHFAEAILSPFLQVVDGVLPDMVNDRCRNLLGTVMSSVKKYVGVSHAKHPLAVEHYVFRVEEGVTAGRFSVHGDAMPVDAPARRFAPSVFASWYWNDFRGLLCFVKERADRIRRAEINA